MQIYGFSRSAAAKFIFMATIGMSIGFPLSGLISDKLRQRKRPLLLLFLLQAIIWCLFFLWNGGKPPENVLYILFFLMGITASASALIIALAKEINDPSFSGTALSVANAGAFCGMSVMQPLLGYLLDLRWDGLVVEGPRSTRWLHTAGSLLPVWHSSLSVFFPLCSSRKHIVKIFIFKVTNPHLQAPRKIF